MPELPVNVSLKKLPLMCSMSMSVSLPVVAGAESRQLGDFTCKEIMAADGDGRDIAIAFLQGYALGQRGPEFDTDDLAEAADKFIDRCLDSPKSKALDVILEVTK